MIQTTGVYHIGIPVGDLDRAERFYSEILGMKVTAQFREGHTPLTRLKCGDEDLVLFKRPKPLNRNSLKEDGIAHQAFEVSPETFDKAIEFLKDKGWFDAGPMVRSIGSAVYFFDSEGNCQQLHFTKQASS